MDLADVVEELYGEDPAGFVARRAALVGQARAAKDRPLAQAIGALRRPTRGAWLVNLLTRVDGDALSELLALGPALAAAHTTGTPAQLREVSRRRQAALTALVARAVGLGRHRGYAASDLVGDEVRRALEAALADESVAAEVTAGRLAVVPATAAAFPLGLFEQPAPTDSGLTAPQPGHPAATSSEPEVAASDLGQAAAEAAEEAAEAAADELAASREAVAAACEARAGASALAAARTREARAGASALAAEAAVIEARTALEAG